MAELGILIVVAGIFAAFLIFGRRTKVDECGGCCAGVEQAQRALRGGRRPDTDPSAQVSGTGSGANCCR